MRYAPKPDPIYLPLNDRQPGSGPNGPELFPACGVGVVDFLVDQVFRPYQCDAEIIVDDGPQLRCDRYAKFGAELKRSPESAHFLLPQLNHHNCCWPGFGGFVTRNVVDADEREWLSISKS